MKKQKATKSGEWSIGGTSALGVISIDFFLLLSLLLLVLLLDFEISIKCK